MVMLYLEVCRVNVLDHCDRISAKVRQNLTTSSCTNIDTGVSGHH